MHAPGPWTRVRVETAEYYVYEINADSGHFASVAGWTHFGTVCPVTEANAQLICKSPALLRVLKSLMEWNGLTGGWDAPCWQEAQALLDEVQARWPSDHIQGGEAGSPPDRGGTS